MSLKKCHDAVFCVLKLLHFPREKMEEISAWKWTLTAPTFAFPLLSDSNCCFVYFCKMSFLKSQIRFLYLFVCIQKWDQSIDEFDTKQILTPKLADWFAQIHVGSMPKVAIRRPQVPFHHPICLICIRSYWQTSQVSSKTQEWVLWRPKCLFGNWPRILWRSGRVD